MAVVKFFCPGCKAKLAAEIEYTGLKLACPHCGKHMKVPSSRRAEGKGRGWHTTEDSPSGLSRPSLTPEEIEFLSSDRSIPD